MEKKQVLNALQQLRQSAKPRKFKQTIDFTINFKNIDFKKVENQVDVDVALPNPIGKGDGKVLLFVRDKEFASQAKDIVDHVMMEDEISKLNKKQIAEITNQYIGFLSEGPVMLTVGKYLGQTLAPKNRMPKPVTMDIKQLQTIVARLKSVVKISNRKGKFMPLVHVSIGKEEMQDEAIAENAVAVYQAVLPAIGNKPGNVKSVLVKMTMSPPIVIGGKQGGALA
ncbi:MAG: hypothetical protein V1776_02865 [Candidatus Diapherotrites archaeon]